MKIKHYLLAFCAFVAFSFSVAAQEVAPTWQALNQRGYPQWFSDAKLGIFIHWGLYSVPAYAGKEGYGEWLYKGLMVGDSGRVAAVSRYPQLPLSQGLRSEVGHSSRACDTSAGKVWLQSVFLQYANLTNYWHAELWNPDKWADLFQKSGARYVMLVTKHHDGYCLWDSPQQPEWNSTMSGPRRNIVAELSQSVRDKGMKMCFYYSLNEWNNPLHAWTMAPADSVGRYVRDYMTPQLHDLVVRYRPSAIFSDGDWDNTAQQYHSPELMAWYYNTVGPEAVVNDRWGNGTQHGFRTPEYSSGITLTDRPWAECRGLGRSFGLNRNEPLENYLSSEELICHFVQLVAAGGGMTLNVGPYADGTIPLLQQERLLDLGNWLAVNGEAIYASRPWTTRFYDFGPVSLQRTDSVIRFDWVRNAPDRKISYDHFTATWRGQLTAPRSVGGEFTLEADADDAVVVVCQNDTLINYAKGDASRQKRTALLSRTLLAQHPEVEVRYDEEDLEARVSLLWRLPDGAVQPARALAGWQAEYTCRQPLVCYTTKGTDLYAIALEWHNTLVIPLADKPRKEMQVSLLGSDRSLEWKWDKKAHAVIVNLSPLSYSDIARSAPAWAFKLSGALSPVSQK